MTKFDFFPRCTFTLQIPYWELLSARIFSAVALAEINNDRA